MKEKGQLKQYNECKTGKFVCAIEDMHLSELPKDAKIVRFTNAPLLIKGLDSSQVICIAEVE